MASMVAFEASNGHIILPQPNMNEVIAIQILERPISTNIDVLTAVSTTGLSHRD